MEIQEKKETDRASLELLYEISREFAAALDLRTVLHRVLFLSMKNVGAVSGSIIVLDDQGQPTETAFLLVGQQVDRSNLQLRITFERGLAGWVARNQQAVLVPDTSQDERWLRRPDDAEDRTGPKSAVSVPILVRENSVGVITLVHPTPGFFSPDHLELVMAIADQAGIAILNARLYAESQRQARVMTAVAESAAVITASLNLDDVLHRILEQVSQALQVEGASLALIDADKSELEFRASTLDIVGSRCPLDQGVVGWVAQEEQGVVVTAEDNDPRFLSEIDRQLDIELRAIMCAPVHSQGNVIGVLEVINPLEETFEVDDMFVLTGIGALAGTAIQHAQLFESLQAAHQRYRELFEDSIDPILITDWDGNILEANRQAEATIGFGSETLQAMNIAGLHDLDEETSGDDFAQLASSETVVYESILRLRDKQHMPVQVYARRVHIDGVPHIQWILRDITESKKLDRMREDLIAMIYHDLRSPLANVVSSLDVLTTMLPLDDKPSAKSLMKIALRSTERIQRLTDSLLDINRLEAGQKIINPLSMAPQRLIEESVDIVLPTAKNKDLDIVVEDRPDLPDILVDVDMMRRVLVNLLENAVKFTPAEGKIYVGAQQEDGYVQIWVRDTGPGISSADQERIFDKFTRLEDPGGPSGLGLGLAFCRLTVAGHGGWIWVESEPGSGSVFSFTIPVAEGPLVE